MATLASPIQFARERAGVDSNSLTNTLAIDFANFAQDKMYKMLIDRGIDACPVQEATRSITDAVGTYLYPSDMFYIPKAMEINWFESSVTDQKYVPLSKITESNMPEGMSIGWMRKNADINNPTVDYRGDYYEIFPTPNASTWGGTSGSSLSGAIRIFYYLTPVSYVTTTTTLVYPESLDYYSFGELIKDIYLNSIGKLSDADLESKFEIVVGKLVKIIQGDGMSPTRAKGLNLTGWEY